MSAKRRRRNALWCALALLMGALTCFSAVRAQVINMRNAVWLCSAVRAPIQTAAAVSLMAQGLHAQPTAGQPLPTEEPSEWLDETPTPDAADEPPAYAAAPIDTSPAPEGAGVIEATAYGSGSGARYIACGQSSIFNCTALGADEVAQYVNNELPFAVELNSSEPQVLIYHTHATECYEAADRSWWDPASTCRSKDKAENMVAVGDVMADALNAAGIHTIHDTTLHDDPSYNGSYASSHAAVERYLQRYPSIKVVLDVHRDAIQRQDGTRIKPVTEINGQKTAQIMIICGADNGGNLPNYTQNLRFAARLQAQASQMYPSLMRPVLFDYRYYNQDLSYGALLLEVGGHANTLPEAKNAAADMAEVLIALFTQPA